MSIQNKIPFLAKLSMGLLSLVLLGFLLYKGKEIFVPLFSSCFLAMLLLPITQWLERIKFPKFLTVLLPLLLGLSCLAGISYFLYRQIARFSDDIPTLKENLTAHSIAAQQWIFEKLNISIRDQEKLLNEMLQKASDAGIMGDAFLTITQILALIILIPVFTFLLLYYKNMIMKFFLEIVKHENSTRLKDMIHESRAISQRYLTGLLIEVFIMAVINSIVLSLLGVKYALLLASIVAIFNLIPYVGILTASLFCMIVTLISSNNLLDVVWVAVALGGVQIIDNYIILPIVVGSKVRINSLATIIGLLVGGLLMGVPGMFLAIPSIAVLKVVFDRIESMRPYGMLLGDNHNGNGQIDLKHLRHLKKQSKGKVVS